MLARNLTSRLLDALNDTPVVFLQGPRQAGKSTLAQSLTSSGYEAPYLTLDDPTTLAAAREDPTGFVSGLAGPIISFGRAFFDMSAHLPSGQRPLC